MVGGFDDWMPYPFWLKDWHPPQNFETHRHVRLVWVGVDGHSGLATSAGPQCCLGGTRHLRRAGVAHRPPVWLLVRQP